MRFSLQAKIRLICCPVIDQYEASNKSGITISREPCI